MKQAVLLYVASRADSCGFSVRSAHFQNYAEQRGGLGNSVVRIYDEAGNVEQEIMPAAEGRMLYRGIVSSVRVFYSIMHSRRTPQSLIAVRWPL